MTVLVKNYQELAFLLRINWDRVLFPVAVACGLTVGALLGGYLV